MSEELDRIIKFIAKNMTHIGWGNWTFAVKRVKKVDNAMAVIEPSEIGKQVIFTLPDAFFELDEYKQNSIIFHEFIHGREWVRQNRVDKYCENIRETEEELFVNDVETFIMNREV